MKIWVLDAETYYINERGGEKYSLSLKGKDRMSTVDYVTDSRWREHGWAVLFPDGKAEFIQPGALKLLLEAIKPEDLILAHNWAFDGLALKYHYGFRHWNVVDTMLLANAVLGTKKDRGRSNSLGELAEELQLPYRKGDLSPVEGKRDLTEDEWEYLALYAKGDVKICKQIFDILIGRLKNSQSEIWLMQHTLNAFINRPICVDKSRVAKATTQLNAWNQQALDRVMTGASRLVSDVMQLSSEKQFAEVLDPLLRQHGMRLPRKLTEQAKRRPTKPTRKKDIEAWETYNKEMAAFVPGKIKTMIPALAKADFGFQKLLVCGVPLIEDLCAARIALKSGRTVAARLKGIQADVAHMSLVYHGAGTGRWTGGGNGWNPQNIPSPSRAPDEETARMSQALRSCLVTKEGYQFVHVDLSQAEARVVAWMAGQWDLMDQFAAGEDVYCSFISKALGREVVKPSKDDASDAAQEMIVLRAVGKESILGLGFGMGKYKFHTRLRAIPSVRRYLGDKLTETFALQLVESYRLMFPHIPAFWKQIEQAFHMARRGATVPCGAMQFAPKPSDGEGPGVWMYYPNGRRVPYSNLRQVCGKTDRKQWVSGSGKKIYGPLVTENAVQGTARDILGLGIYKCEEAGYPVVLTVHDSLILEVLAEQADAALEFALETLRTPPKWAPRLALDAEGHISGDFN